MGSPDNLSWALPVRPLTRRESRAFFRFSKAMASSSNEALILGHRILRRHGCPFASFAAFPHDSEGPFIGRQQILDGIPPGQFVFDPGTSELAHPFPLLRIFEQPKNFGREVRYLVLITGVK